MATLNEGMNTILQGDCAHALIRVPSASVDLIVTSPPYAERRKHTYGGIKPEEYVDWFLYRAYQFKRVLKPTGSLIVNIKEHAVAGERHPYVLELMLSMREKWCWIDEFIWHKTTCYPGRYPNRLKNAWERCLHFSKQKNIAFYPDAVRVPAAESTVKRLKTLSERDKNRSQMGGVEERRYRNTGSTFSSKDEQIDKSCVRYDGRNKSGGMNKCPDDLISRTPMTLPSNVLHLAPEGKNVGHSAAFPEALPAFFIKLLTQEDDVVLDPFCGSGTSLVVAKKLNRRFIGVDILPENVELSWKRVGECLPQKKTS